MAAFVSEAFTTFCRIRGVLCQDALLEAPRSKIVEMFPDSGANSKWWRVAQKLTLKTSAMLTGCSEEVTVFNVHLVSSKRTGQTRKAEELDEGGGPDLTLRDFRCALTNNIKLEAPIHRHRC